MHNVTIDDDDPAIIYQPPASWIISVFDVLDAGGQHHVTSDPDATASFTFTGIAIYFYSPLWTFSVTTQVTLDDLPPVLLDLRDYTQPLDINGPETVQSSVVWSQTGLANTRHTLLVSAGAGQTIAILDTLVYTAQDANNIPSLSSTSSTLPSSTSTPNPSIASEHSSRRGLSVTLAVVCTVFGILVISGIWWLIRRRGDDDGDDGPQTIDPPEMSNTTPPAYYSSRSAPSHERDAMFRSTPTEVITITNTRRTRPSSTTRHSTVTSSKLKNPLTPIPEALREPSMTPHTSSRSPVQDRQCESLPSASSQNNNNNNDDGREEVWLYNTRSM